MCESIVLLKTQSSGYGQSKEFMLPDWLCQRSCYKAVVHTMAQFGLSSVDKVVYLFSVHDWVNNLVAGPY